MRGKGSDPDRFLAASQGVAYRYRLAFSDAGAASDILRVVREFALPMEYLLLVPAGQEGVFRAYLGLRSAEVADLPLRLAALGVRVDRGEEVVKRSG